MKKIYKSLMALAAALLLVPSAFAQTELPVQYQHEKYLKNEKGTIGYNKYLVSNTPDAEGYYTLRIENFVTGTIDSHAVPTDFVLVLDNSGSMHYDYRRTGYTMPKYLSVAGNQTFYGNAPLLIEENGGGENGYVLGYRYAFVSGSYKGAGSNYVSTDAFANEGSIPSQGCRYYYYEDPAPTVEKDLTGYYYIYHKRINVDGAYHNNLCIRVDGVEKYLWDTSLHDEPNTGIPDLGTNPGAGDDRIIYTGKNIWRPLQRREALINAVETFVTQIKAENDKDQWEEGVVKHQVAIVAFGSNYRTGSNATGTTPTTTVFSNYDSYTKVIRDFTEVSDPSVFTSTMTNTMQFRGSTYIDYGVTLGRMLFEQLQAQEGMGPKTDAGGVNRNKVMIVLTDGEPSGHTTASGGSGGMGTINETLVQGKKVKAERKTNNGSEIDGKIYTIDLQCVNNSKIFLGHLSSNYIKGSQTAKTGGWGSTGYYNGDSADDGDVADADGFYRDASNTDLSEIFSSIASANTGETKQMVAVDAMSDDFVIPFGTTDVDKVKIYTAQCIGTKEIDGEEYLAFAREVPAPSREAVSHLWVPRVVGTGEEATTEWVDLGDPNPSDIDGTTRSPKITFSVSNDGKKIILKGFNYSEYYCGIDTDPDHTEGPAANERQMAADDPNAAYADPENKYRGFKMIFEFPIALDPDALGGVNVPTNDVGASGLFISGEDGNPIGDPEVNYPTPNLPVPVKLIIQKTGLKPGESANFTVQRKRREGNTATWEDFTTFVLTGDATKTPEVRIINLDPAYFYKVKEGNWSWAYEGVSQEYSTETTGAKNPIVFNNTPEDETPKHAEAKADNKLKSW